MKIVVGTRGSKLAVTQTNMVLDMIKEKCPEVEFEVRIIKTKGDLILDKPIDKIGGKEIFIKEIEKELLDSSIDLAIHSMKDMPGELPKGLRLSYIPKREDHRDVLVLREGLNSIDDLPQGAIIGTGSKRRKYQLLKYREDLNIVGIRGNIETRIGKIVEDNLDGVVLAAAGINRLGVSLENKVIALDTDLLLSSPCQGILGIEIREDDENIHNVIKSISDELTEVQAKVERDFLKGTGGSCNIPVGAYCRIEDSRIHLDGILGSEDGQLLVRKSMEGSLDDIDTIGGDLAKLLTEEIDKYEG